MKALVINCSEDYNLATAKIAVWLRQQGHEVDRFVSKGFCVDNLKSITDHKYDAVYLSALYTWDLPVLVEAAHEVKQCTKVEIGGPAASIMPDYIFEQTGIKPTIGLDDRFDAVPARYLSTYTSRGCIRNCPFCSIPIIEGGLRENADFVPASYVLDANFLACSKSHIENACEKLSELKFVDLLHGLDARLLESWHVELFLKRLRMPVWRFTFDSLKHETELKDMLRLLKDYGIRPEEKVIIYCLYGFDDTPSDAYERAEMIMSLCAHAYAMRFQPLDALTKDQHVPDRWDAKTMLEFWDFCNKPTLAWLNQQLRQKHLRRM